MTKQVTLKTAIATILSLTVVNVAYAAVPNTFTAGQAATAASVNANFSNLDTRVEALESATAEPAASVAIDCGADANALKNTSITENTTYNISGACTGPIYIEVDNVHLLGTSNTSDSIVLPAGIEDSAVWADGAHNLKITNLFLDLTETTSAHSASGLSARHSFVRLSDSRVQGGMYGIEPFRGGIIRLEGENSITEFMESGLSAGDQANINTRGQTTVTSTHANTQAITAYRGSTIYIREGITVSVPDGSAAVRASQNSVIRIRDRGTVSITGHVGNYHNSSIQIDKGAINGDVESATSSTLRMNNNVTVNGNVHIGDTAQWRMNGGSVSGNIEVYRGGVVKLEGVTQASNDNHAIRVNSNSLLDAHNSHLGNFSVNTNSTISLGADEGNTSSVKGGEIHLGSVGSIRDTSSTADISLFPPAGLHLTGSSNLNNNNLYLCGTSSFIEGSVAGIANNGATGSCRP